MENTHEFLAQLQLTAGEIPKNITNLKVRIFVMRKFGRVPKLRASALDAIPNANNTLKFRISAIPQLLKRKDVGISRNNANRIKQWIVVNEDALLQYWNYEISLQELCEKLQAFQPSTLPHFNKQDTTTSQELSDEQKRKMCYSKRVYYTVQAARKGAKTARFKYGKPFYAYMCPICGYYHLTTHKKDGTLYLN